MCAADAGHAVPHAPAHLRLHLAHLLRRRAVRRARHGGEDRGAVARLALLRAAGLLRCPRCDELVLYCPECHLSRRGVWQVLLLSSHCSAYIQLQRPPLPAQLYLPTKTWQQPSNLLLCTHWRTMPPCRTTEDVAKYQPSPPSCMSRPCADVVCREGVVPRTT